MPAQAFYMMGNLATVMAKAEQLSQSIATGDKKDDKKKAPADGKASLRERFAGKSNTEIETALRAELKSKFGKEKAKKKLDEIERRLDQQRRTMPMTDSVLI